MSYMYTALDLDYDNHDNKRIFDVLTSSGFSKRHILLHHLYQRRFGAPRDGH